MSAAASEGDRERAEVLRARMRDNIATMRRKTKIVDIGSMRVEIRELSYGKRMSIVRELARMSDTDEGRALFEELDLTPSEYQTFALVVEVAYFEGTDVRVWPDRNAIPELLEATEDALEALGSAVVHVLNLNPDEPTEASPDVDETEKNSST